MSLFDGMTVNATVYLASQPDVAEIKQSLRAILEKLSALQRQGEQLMAQNAANKALLDEINVYTNQMADRQAANTAKLEEIASDLDALIEASTDTATTEQLQAIRDKAALVAAEGDAQGATLQALAAKYDQPLPPPVEPPV